LVFCFQVLLNTPTKIFIPAEGKELPEGLPEPIVSLPPNPSVEQLQNALKSKKPNCAGISASYSCGNHDSVPQYSGSIVSVAAGDEIAMNSMVLSVVSIRNGEPPTTEQLQTALKTLKPTCAGIVSEYSCGNHNTAPAYNGEIISVNAGDEVAMNTMIISIVDIDGSGNGSGLIKVPMMNNIKIGVALSGIKVAKGGCIVAGKAETSGIDVAILNEKQRQNLAKAYEIYKKTLDIAEELAPEIAKGINSVKDYFEALKAKKEATKKLLAQSNLEDLSEVLNNCAEIVSQSRVAQDSLEKTICLIKTGKAKGNIAKLEKASKANIDFINKLGPALAQCQSKPNWQNWEQTPCKGGPCVDFDYSEFECKKVLKAIFAVTEKTLNDCDKKIENSKPLIELAKRAIKGDCGTDIDDKIGDYTSDFAKLCDVYRFGFIECLAETPCVGDDEVNINKLLQTTPQADVSKIKSSLLKNSNLDKLIGAIDGDNFDEFIRIITSSKFSGTKPKITENTFVFNSDDALPFEIDENGILTFNSRKNFHFGYYQEMNLKAFDWVTVIFADDFIWNGKKYKKGEIGTMPAMALWALFNQSERNKNKLAVSGVIDIGLTFVGVGAIKNLRHLPKIYRIIAATKAGMDVATGLGGFVMAAGLEDELSLTLEGQEVIAYWTWFNLVYGTASLSYEGVAALYRNADKLLSSGKNLSAGMKAWLPKLKEKLEVLAKSKGWKLDIKEIVELGGSNSKIVNGIHTITNVRFEEKAIEYGGKIYKGLFAQFDNVFRCKISKDLYLKTDYIQFTNATRQLKAQIQKTPELARKFTKKGLEDILAEKDRIDGFTWHHNEDEGILELVERGIHGDTSHIGGRNIWGGGTNYR
jgi:tetratricopeptide (TPR) repeat protein